MGAIREHLIRIGLLRRAVRRAKVLSKISRYRAHRLLNRFDPMRRTACTRDTLRCRDDIHSANYCFHCLGQDTPVCCISKVAEILFWLADVFDEHDIPYFVLWGTHLGAIRHRGFIPWDLDADIGIEAANEERALQLISAKAAERGYRVTKDDEYTLRVAYSRTNFQHVDVELWRQHEHAEDSLYTHTLYGEVVIPRADMFPLTDYPFYDRTLRGPRKDDYLRKALGNTIYTHGYRRYDLTSDEEFALKDPPPASIRTLRGR
jgi:hypothetical protein